MTTAAIRGIIPGMKRRSVLLHISPVPQSRMLGISSFAKERHWNIAYFVNTFRRETGLTPRKYRTVGRTH